MGRLCGCEASTAMVMVDLMSVRMKLLLMPLVVALELSALDDEMQMEL